MHENCTNCAQLQEKTMYERYREFAEAQGLTDYAVSVKAKVSRNAISEWKTGKHKCLSLGNRFKIAQILGTNNDFTKKIG